MRLKTVSLAFVALLALASAPAAFADPVTVDFTGVAGGQNPLTTYSENGFTVTNNSNWYTSTSGGNPSPDAAAGYYFNPIAAANTAVFTLTDAGSFFGITSFDVREFAPTVTYTIVGYVGATVAYTFTGTESSSGWFTIDLASIDQSIMVNSATFTLSIPSGSTGNNARFGLDNIDLMTPTPEPSSLALLATGMLGMAMFVGRRRLFHS